MSISAMNTANFGQSFSPYTNNQSLPLQHPGFPNPGQQAPNFAQNASQQQQQQYQQMPGGKSKSPHDSVVVHVLMCFASSRFRSRRTALFSIHVAVGRNVHDSVPFTSCLTLCCLCSRTRLASAIAHGSPAIPTTPLPVCCCISANLSQEKERIALLLDINVELLQEMHRLQAQGKGGATSQSAAAHLKSQGLPDALASDEYTQ
ncbi:unnamed protein product [Aureobasidium pullulans]|nr:unnamed protein product [Aureobasidium pullulans]